MIFHPQSAQLLAVSLLAQSIAVNAHTFMQHPVPFASQLRDNSPMNKDGSNWPCKGETEFDPAGVMNVWERGSTQYLQAMGGASHGGGSCQISITTDTKPTRYSNWTVIHSIHGGCPIRNLTETNYGLSSDILLPSVYNFTIPDWVPLGRAVMAWTWYGRWSVPEMFMNCAPIMVLGGTANKDVFDPTGGFDELRRQPLMFEANNGNGCWTKNGGSCVIFPEPGDSVEVNEECPFDKNNMFDGTCGKEYRIGNMSGAWTLGRWVTGMFVVCVVVGLVVSIWKVFRGKRHLDSYEKVLQA
ncbi:hypothetical protein BKA64DRAFT_675076 [Cadophora sp. MPI-SDFR-AT-0126]|nr:hypothetical protein BKA64DRAFT_675076 [Leotiomycetes sp. MPI-SDFR-AT-0126]